MARSYSFDGIAERRAVAAAVIEPVLVGQRDRKVAGTYKRLVPHVDGRIRTVLSPDTASFRLSSGESGLYPSTNLQNLEKKVAKLDPLYQVRDIFVPKPGMVLLAGDFKNAEALLVFAYSNDWTYVDKIYQGDDIHTEHALHFYGALSDNPNTRKLQRDVSKTLTYASFYAAAVRTILININKEADTTGTYFTEAEIARLHRILLSLHPLEQWWADTERYLLLHHGVVRNCLGYRRTFYDTDLRESLKKALSFYPQSTVAWLQNEAMPKIHNEVDKEGRRELLLQIHDELLFQCYPDEIPFIVQHARPHLERTFTINGRELYIPVDWKVGPSWGAMKDITL